MNYPPLIDIQVNGYAGVPFFRGLPSEDDVRQCVAKLKAGHVGAIFATVITDKVPAMAERLANLRKITDSDPELRAMIPAFHIEGPCISPEDGYKGAHPADCVVPPSRDAIEPMIEAAGGPERVGIVTLAPEYDKGLKTIAWLADLGIVVSAGHCNTPYEVLREAQDAGLRMFTHLGNGSAAQMDRHDNIIMRALDCEKLTYGIIPDGNHLPYFVVRNYIKAAGIERCIFTTDCVANAGAPDDYEGALDSVLDKSGDSPTMRVRGTPYLAGSACTPERAYQLTIEKIGLNEAQAKAVWHDNAMNLFGSKLSAPAA